MGEGDKNGGENSKGRERKVSYAKKNFFTSIDETFRALAPPKRGWVGGG
jgi:hypothetical protein